VKVFVVGFSTFFLCFLYQERSPKNGNKGDKKATSATEPERKISQDIHPNIVPGTASEREKREMGLKQQDLTYIRKSYIQVGSALEQNGIKKWKKCWVKKKEAMVKKKERVTDVARPHKKDKKTKPPLYIMQERSESLRGKRKTNFAWYMTICFGKSNMM
jgi:hypothetical protein